MVEENKLENKIKDIKNEMDETTTDIEKEVAKLRDPTVHAAIMYATVREKENTNRILKTIHGRLDNLDERIKDLEKVLRKRELKKEIPKPSPKISLSDIDRKIVDLINKKNRITAEEIRIMFEYKGRNAACARLNRLSELGILEKERSGRVVYYVSGK